MIGEFDSLMRAVPVKLSLSAERVEEVNRGRSSTSLILSLTVPPSAFLLSFFISCRGVEEPEGAIKRRQEQ